MEEDEGSEAWVGVVGEKKGGCLRATLTSLFSGKHTHTPSSPMLPWRGVCVCGGGEKSQTYRKSHKFPQKNWIKSRSHKEVNSFMPALRIWPIIPTPPNYRIKRLFLFLRLVLTVPEGPTGPNLEAVRARAWAGARVCERMCALPAPYCWRPPAYGMRVSFDRALPFFLLLFFCFFSKTSQNTFTKKRKKSLRLDFPPPTPQCQQPQQRARLWSEQVWSEGAFTVRVFSFFSFSFFLMA